jgi:hypothetical protein
MVRVLLVGQDKGGVGKSVISRGLGEVLPGAPIFEIDTSPRMLELGERVRFFPMRATRKEIDLSGGAAARGEFDRALDAMASVKLPTVVDIGANTAASLLAVIGGLAEQFAAVGVEFGILVVSTTDAGALADAPKLLALATPFVTAKFLVANRLPPDFEKKHFVEIAQGATISYLLNKIMAEPAADILRAGGLAPIPHLDPSHLSEKFGFTLGGRVHGDLTSFRLEVMESVRLAAEWLIG